MIATTNFQPNWVTPPGQTIADILHERKIPNSEFATKVGLTLEFTKSLLDGNEKITEELALMLVKVFGGPSTRFWLEREKNYREYRKVLEGVTLEDWLRLIPLKEMVKHGWIDENGNPIENCLKFFGVPNVESLNIKYHLMSRAVRFRTTKTFDSKIGSTMAWVRRGEILASNMDCKKWNPQLLENELPNIKSLTRKKSPSVFLPELVKLCSMFGVAVVIVKTPPGCTASGATKFLTKEKAMLLLSFRYLSDDQFWFTFFHEVGHLLLHGKNQVFIEDMEKESVINQEEKDANFFSGEVLIPTEYHDELRKLKRNKRSIVELSIKLGVSPGIIIGQMQHLGIIDFKYLNSYKRRYKWDDINLGAT